MEGPSLPAKVWDGFNRMPDKGVVKYVEDTLRERFDIDTTELPDHWIPLGVLGTLDWVMICGWWIFRNTGFFETDEPHRFVFNYNGCELDPTEFMMFLEELQRNKFSERFETPGINGKERSEALQFLRVDVYEHWAKTNGKNPEQFVPPDYFIEILMYATFMWVLSPYGKDWIYMQDEVLACVLDYGAAYVDHSMEEDQLLDPAQVTKTNRPLQSCAVCQKVLWCVRGAYYVKDGKHRWESLCNNCYVGLKEQGHGVETKDERLSRPHCPHLPDQDGIGGTCATSCPHSKDFVWDRLEKKGEERLEHYRDRVRAMGGQNPRQLAGQTVEDVVDYFK